MKESVDGPIQTPGLHGSLLLFRRKSHASTGAVNIIMAALGFKKVLEVSFHLLHVRFVSTQTAQMSDALAGLGSVGKELVREAVGKGIHTGAYAILSAVLATLSAYH